MKIGSIEVPWRLIRSIESGQLVVFVGAGASADSPSDLPDFQSLADQIAENSVSQEKNEPIERYLGRVQAKAEIHVHRRAAQILSGSGTAPNELHRLILSVFQEASQVRVVTTNFDLHLESGLGQVFGESSADCEVYRAPALPTGEDFQGLVYLHGSVAPEPARMVLTDEDFGRAYLTQGWARRFLIGLFHANDVLFIGYSHTDQILNYLARGLPPDGRRYRAALTEEGQIERWQHLGIEPLEYRAGDHFEVRKMLEGWTRLRGLKAQEHEVEIRELVRRPLALLTQQDNDRLLWVVQEERYQHLFYKNATNPQWLDWANGNGLLNPVFDPESQDGEMMTWFSLDPLAERGDKAIAIVGSQTRRLAHGSWNSLAHRIWVNLRSTERDPSEDEMRRLAQWISVLRSQDEPSRDWQLLEYLVGELPLSSKDLILELLDALTEPQLVPTDRPRYFREESSLWGSEIRYRLPRHTSGVEKCWENVVVPNMESFSAALLILVQSQLERAYRLLHSVGEARTRFDPYSFHRTTIEESDQTLHPNGATDFLVRAGRSALEWMVMNEPKRGEATVEAWLDSSAVLLQRLALHAAAIHQELSATRLLQYLLDRGRINQHQLHHEVFGLLTVLYPRLGTAGRKRLIGAKRRLLKEEYSGEESDGDAQAERTHAYEWFAFLSWLARADSSCELVQRQLKIVRDAYPNFVERDRPDLTHYVAESSYVGPIEPLTVSEMLVLSPKGVYSRYRQLTDEPTYGLQNKPRGFLDVLSNTVKEDFEWSLELASDVLASRQNDDRALESLQVSLLSGWQDSDLDADQWRRVIRLLRGSGPPEAVEHEVVDLLQHRLESNKRSLDCPTIRETLPLALSMYRRLHDTAEVVDCLDDPLTQAINHPSGKLAVFAVNALSSAIKQDCGSRDDLPELFELLDSFIEDVEHSRMNGAVVLAGQLHFMLIANREWAVERLLPLLAYEAYGSRAMSLWSGFFSWSRLTPGVLDTVVPMLAEILGHLDEFSERIRGQVDQYVAGIAYRLEESPIETPWFRRYLRASSDEDRQRFAWGVRDILSDLWEARDSMEVEKTDELWRRLLKGYVDTRLRDRGVGDAEWSGVAYWCLYLDEAFPDFVELFTQGPEPMDPHTGVFHRLGESDHLYNYADDLARLTVHILGGQRRNSFWAHDDVRSIVGKLEGAGASGKLIDEIKNKTIELGASSSFFDSQS